MDDRPVLAAVAAYVATLASLVLWLFYEAWR